MKTTEFCCAGCGDLFHNSCGYRIEDDYVCYDCHQIHIDNLSQSYYQQLTDNELLNWGLL